MLFRSVLARTEVTAELICDLHHVHPGMCRVAIAAKGAHRILANHALLCRSPGQLIQSNGLCHMGYALPAAIGAALAKPGAPVVAMIGDGSLLMELGVFRFLDGVLGLYSNLAVAWNHRGNALLERGRNVEALQSYDRSIAIRPDIAEVWRHRAVALMQLEHHADALESLNKAIALVPNDAFAFQERGNLLMRLNRHADAVADFSRALAVRPDDPDLLYSRGNTHSILKNYPETIRDCTRLLQIQPDYPYARGVLVHSKLQCCDWTGLDDQQREISLGIAGGKRVVSPFNHKALSDSPEEQLQCASNWVRHECPPTRPLWQGESYKHDRIRLAYQIGRAHV